MQEVDSREEGPDEDPSASGAATDSALSASCRSCAPFHGIEVAASVSDASPVAPMIVRCESLPRPPAFPLSWRNARTSLGDVPVSRSHMLSGAVTTNARSCLAPPHGSDSKDAGIECMHAGDRESDNLTATDATSLLPASGGGRTGVFECAGIPSMLAVLLFLSSLVHGFSSSIISIFMNVDLALQPVEVAQYWVYIGCTMWFQPILGYISDALVVVGERRRPLFLMAAVCNTVIYAAYGLSRSTTSSFTRFVALSIVSQFCTMGLYIPLNGLLVEVGRHDAETARESSARTSSVMSAAMIWRSAGSLAGAVLHTCLIAFLPVRPLLGITGLLFLTLVPTALCAPRDLFLHGSTQEDRLWSRVAKAGRMLWSSFDLRDRGGDGACVALALSFVFVYTMTPNPGFVYNSYLYVVFEFPNWFYSMNSCIGHLGSIAGAWAFSWWMGWRAMQEARSGTHLSLFCMFVVGSVAWVVGCVTNLFLCTGIITETLGLSASVYVPVDSFITSLVARFAIMPALVMAAEHAPKSFEATAFEVFSVASMGGGLVSGLLTSSISIGLHITRSDYSKLWLLFVVSMAAKPVPILLAYFLLELRSSYSGEGHGGDAIVVIRDEAIDVAADTEGVTR
ncbi:hypothetical protein LSCM1_02030 [Leishmania martiniquensis]|uniref:BT1 family protein n=1 Tax=Leishmania martiniquensis TaxID=1580590 RepID=A0A836KHD0_9TRYP|nr:hypothetical protein LSCM1_02030 [Leishmania martiniquensis]